MDDSELQPIYILIDTELMLANHTRISYNFQSRQPKLLRWRRPIFQDAIVVSCDGSFRNSNGTAGYGIVLRDWYGRFVKAKAKHFHKSNILKNEQVEVEYGVMVLMIEMLAIRDGLRLARNLNLKNVEIQSDSKSAISIIMGDAECPSQCFGIYYDILREMPFFRRLGYFFIYRERNRAADFLSKVLTSDGEKHYNSLPELPKKLQSIIFEDSIGVPVLRF